LFPLRLADNVAVRNSSSTDFIPEVRRKPLQ
jgi:hypothetical protein